MAATPRAPPRDRVRGIGTDARIAAGMVTYGSVVGTRARTGASTVVVESNGASQTYHYTVAGGALTMTVSPTCDALCLCDVRRFYDLIDGTVVAGRRDYGFGFTRVPS